MTSLRTVLSVALWWVSNADTPSIFGPGADVPEGSGEGTFESPDGFKCSNGVRLSDWTSYLDDTWINTEATTVAECWTAVQAQFPDAEGVLFMKIPVCRAMTNFAVLAPDGVLAEEYADYQGTAGVCQPLPATNAPTPQFAFTGKASHIHGGVMVLGAMMATQAALLLS